MVNRFLYFSRYISCVFCLALPCLVLIIFLSLPMTVCFFVQPEINGSLFVCSISVSIYLPLGPHTPLHAVSYSRHETSQCHSTLDNMALRKEDSNQAQLPKITLKGAFYELERNGISLV